MREVDSNLIRSYIDGELPPEAAEEVRVYLEAHPEAAARAEFERRLAVSVRRNLSDSPAAPSELVRAVRDALNAEAPRAAQQAESNSGTAQQGGFARVVTAAQALVASVMAPRPVSLGAIVAVLVLVGGVVLFSIVAPQIDTIAPNGSAGLVSDPAEYVSAEHDRCTSDPERYRKKVRECTAMEAALSLRELFDVDAVTVFDLSEAGYDFLGQGRCGIPGTEQSAHLVYGRRAGDRSPAKLSIFIATAGTEFPPKSCRGKTLQPGRWQSTDGGPKCSKEILQSTDNVLVYYLVCSDQEDARVVSEVVGRALVARTD